MDVKIPKSPLFQSFRHYEIAHSFHFLSDFRVFQYVSTINFFFNFIRIFDVIYEALYLKFQCYTRTTLRFTKEEAEVQKQALSFVPARYIRTSEAFIEHDVKKRPDHIYKNTFVFLSLRYSADFRRSRLF